MGAIDREWIEEVRTRLAAAGDPVRAQGQQRYMKSAMPYHGVAMPDLRRLLRPLIADATARWIDRGTWTATVRALWDEADHREQRYAAIALGAPRAFGRWQDVDAIAVYRHMIVTGAWWDYVDDVAIHRVGPIVHHNRAVGDALMLAWAGDADMWVRRAAIIHQISFASATDRDVLASVITRNLDGSRFGAQFFVRKAIGWALRSYAYVDPSWVRTFVGVHEGRMSGLSRREALKHLG